MSTTGVIYALAEPGTGAIRYCGKTMRPLRHRITRHLLDARFGYKSHLYYWIRSVQARGGTPSVIVCESIDISELTRDAKIVRLNEAEKRWIAQLRALGFNLTNATNGGDGGGRKLTVAEKEKLRVLSLGSKRSPESKKLMSESARRRDPATRFRGPTGRTPAWADPQARSEKLRKIWENKTAEEKAAHVESCRMSPGGRKRQSARHRGSKNVNAAVTEDIAAELFLAKGTNVEIGRLFGVSAHLVGRIKLRQTWRHVTEQLTQTEE